MDGISAITERIRSAFARIGAPGFTLDCVGVRIDGLWVHVTIRVAERDPDGQIASICEQEVRFLPANAFDAAIRPDQLDAFLEGWAAAVPALYARAAAPVVPSDLVFPEAYIVLERRAAAEFASALADPDLPARLGHGVMRSEQVTDLSETAPIATHPELEAAIERDPDDIEARLVYADWLQSRGDPRGDLIAGDVPGATDAAVRRANEVLVVHHRYFLGPLTYDQPCLSLDWRAGYIDAVRIALELGEHDRDPQLGPALVRAVLALPSARFLRELTVGILGHGGEWPYDGLAPAFEAAGPRPTMRSLFLGDFEFPEQSEISWVTVGDVSPILALLPNLRSLRLRGAHIGIGALPCPQLESLVLETGGLPRQPVAALVQAALPALHTLELWFGSPRYGAESSLADVLPLLDGRFPRLRHLGLRNAAFADDLARALLDAPVLPRLEALDLSLGTLTDAGAELLAARRADLGHLQRLDVSGCLLTERGVALIQGVCAEVVAGSQRPSYGGELYVAVGE